MYRLAVLIAVLLAPLAAAACSIADPYRFNLPRYTPQESDEYQAPYVRLHSIDLGVKGSNSARCEGFGTVAFSVPKEQLPEGFGLHFEQVLPTRYVSLGPQGAFWTDYELDGRYIFLFPWIHSRAQSERVSITVRVRIVSRYGVAGRDAYLRYQLPAAGEI